MLRCENWAANDGASGVLEALIGQIKQPPQAGKALFGIGRLVDGSQCCLDHGVAARLILLFLGPQGPHKADDVCRTGRSVLSCTRPF